MMYSAIARRIRSNYLWILLIQTLAYAGNDPATTDQLLARVRKELEAIRDTDG